MLIYYLKYIALVKFFSVILIIKWHLVHQINWTFHVGARMVEILFISSGFLIGYNYYNTKINSSFEYSFKYAYKHLRTFYPLYLINTIINLIENKIRFNYINKKPFPLLTNIEIILVKITLLQSWSRYIRSIFNESSWFISVLMFLYFLSPLLLKGLKNIKLSFTLFIIVAGTRFLVEYFVKNGAANFFDTTLYFGPIIRLLEFYLGMLIVPLFFYIKVGLEQIKKYRSFLKVYFTIIQIFFPFQEYIIMEKYNHLYSSYHVILCSFFMLIIGLDYGYLSNIINNKLLNKLINCQYEIYILQFRMEIFFKRLYPYKLKNNILYIELLFLLKMILIFLVAYNYKVFLKEKFAKQMDKIILFFAKIYKIN